MAAQHLPVGPPPGHRVTGSLSGLAPAAAGTAALTELARSLAVTASASVAV
jgi:hypothetical protein